MTNQTTPRMRTARGAVAFLKELDPGSEVTEHFIRQLIKTRRLPSVPVGTKRLVNVDQLLDYLKGEAS